MLDRATPRGLRPTALLVLATSCALLVLAGSRLPLAAADKIQPLANPYTPAFSGKARVHCYCVLLSGGCGYDFFTAGVQTHNWWQQNSFTKSMAVDLAEACHRKRDVQGEGEGLCCPVDKKDSKPDTSMLHRFFAATEAVPVDH